MPTMTVPRMLMGDYGLDMSGLALLGPGLRYPDPRNADGYHRLLLDSPSAAP